jgi:hypothetical protein
MGGSWKPIAAPESKVDATASAGIVIADEINLA